MEQVNQLSEFGKVFIFLIMGIFFVLFSFFLARLIAPRKPNPAKLTTYECGEEPSGSSWIQFNSRFYIVALVFLLFDVEMIFIFPWATVFGQPELIAADARWGWLTLTEMFVFVGILLLGLVYVWKKGDLQWIRPIIIRPVVATAVPKKWYDLINEEVYRVKKFEPNASVSIQKETISDKPAANIPRFKPTFKKPVQ